LATRVLLKGVIKVNNQLRAAFLQAGLIPEKQVREADAEQFLRAEMEAAKRAKPAKEKEKRMGILAKTTAPDLFRREARKTLLLYPDVLQEIISLAHAQGMKEKKSKGGSWLVANLYQLREALTQPGLSDEAKKALVDKLFANK
jgi:flagellar biosynthesis/type III secretory pathway protein FliH